MIRALTLAAVVALASAPAVAQLRPTSIEDLRRSAAAGMAPTNSDIDVLLKCHNLQRFPADMTPAEFAEARALHIDAGALWLRKNDAAIAECLAGLSVEQRTE
jgi:hypothetical protein